MGRRREPKKAEGYENMAAPPAPKREHMPQPVFNGVGEKLMYQYALESNPRQPGEDVIAWLERVKAAVLKQEANAREMN